MTGRLQLKPGHAVLVALCLVVAGGALTFTAMRMFGGARGQAPAMPPLPVAVTRQSTLPDAESPKRPDVQVAIPDDVLKRSNITLSRAVASSGSSGFRIPGTVEPNAYRQVVVNSLASGRVVAVSADLGATVRRGQTLARIYSSELSEAEQRLVAARAMLDAHDKELRRTEKLASIGAASRQEVERIHAEHAAQTAEVESARSRVQLLGGFNDEDNSDRLVVGEPAVLVAAPITGVVTERTTNVGENVEAAAKLFTVVDLSSVWIVGDVLERDLPAVRVGTEVYVTSPSAPDLAGTGRVSYVDPQVNPTTRTGRIRVELANPDNHLRLGMYVDLLVRSATTSTGAVAIPKTAVQIVGDSHVVYVAVPDTPGSFIERAVRLGGAAGDTVEVLAGLQAGDSVVAGGSFSLRAEIERAGLRRAGSAPSSASSRQTTPTTQMTEGTAARGKAPAEPQLATVVVSEKGFEPSTLKLRAGQQARVTFRRTTDQTCATAVVFPSLKIKRDLPLNQSVVIEFTPQAGELAFACGMNMFKGSIVVQ